MNDSALITILSNLSLLSWLIAALISISTFIVSALAFLLWNYKKNRRFYKNLKRKIMMINTNHADVTKAEDFKYLRRHLESAGLFTIPNEIGTVSDIDSISSGKYSLIILAADSDMSNWEAIFNIARQHKLFVLIYTFGGAVNRDAIATKTGGYTNWNFANNQASLTNTLFTTLATFSPDL